jgi:hypothetical protein
MKMPPWAIGQPGSQPPILIATATFLIAAALVLKLFRRR